MSSTARLRRVKQRRCSSWGIVGSAAHIERSSRSADTLPLSMSQTFASTSRGIVLDDSQFDDWMRGLGKLAGRSRQPFGQSIPIGDVDREGLLKNLEQSLCRCRVLVDSLQHRDGLTLAVDAALPALNAHLGVLKKVFRVRAGHQAVYQPKSPLGPIFRPWNRFGPRLALSRTGQNTRGPSSSQVFRTS